MAPGCLSIRYWDCRDNDRGRQETVLPSVMKRTSNPISISDNHRRAIGSTLRALDELLFLFERWMRDPPAQGPLYREKDTLTEGQKSEVRAEIKALRSLIAEMRDVLGLEPRTEDLSGAIWSRSVAWWEALVELESRHLRRYGDMPESLADYIDPRARRMLEHLQSIAEKARRWKPEQSV